MTELKEPIRLAVLISGTGTNLQAIIDAISTQKLPATIAVVISSRADVMGLSRAEKASIPTEVLLLRDHPDRTQYDKALQQCVAKYDPHLIILSGFMHILSPDFVGHFPERILNIHPSLLPKYPGLHTYERAIEAGDKRHGTTVHIVTADLDAGPILAQEAVEILPKDTPDTLKQKVQALEHALYPEVIRRYAIELFGHS